MNSLLYM